MRKSLFIALISILILACVKDKKTSWDTNFLAPIVTSELSISDLLDSKLVAENPDSSLKLIYSTELYSISTDNLTKFPDTVLEFGASLRSLELPNDTFTYELTLGAIARAEGGFLGAIIIASHNKLISLPELTGLSSGDIEIDMGNLFESMIINEGTAEIIVTNNLPVGINDVDFMVNNASIHGGSLILRDTFVTIPKNTTFNKEIPLNGKTLYSDLIAQIVSLYTSASGTPVLIDTNAALTAQIIIKNLKPKEANAIWPQQNVINKTTLVTFSLDTNYLFKDAILKDGEINFDLYSSLQDSIRITYTLPNIVHPVTKEPFKIDTVIPPAIANGLSKINLIYPMDGYYFLLNGYGIESHYSPEIDFDGSGTAGDAKEEVNAFITTLEAKIQYSGQLKKISIDDSIYVHASITDLTPKYVRGHIGNNVDKFGPDTINVKIFDNIRSGSINLEEVNFEIEIDNGIGVTALATFNKLQSKSKQGNLVSLNMTNNTMNIAKALDMGTAANHISSSKILNSGNSNNITDFMSNLPNKIIYDINVEINGVDHPSNNVDTIINNPPNFLYHESGMKANLNMEIPLSFFADSLVLVDTLDFNFNSEENGGIQSGEFTLLVDNGFPFNATTTIYFMNDNYIIIDSLWNNQTIIKGNIGAEGKVLSSNQSQIKFNINKAKMDVIKTATKMYIIAGFHTFDILDPSAVHHKIYSYYNFNMKLVGDFNYTLSN